MYGPMYYLVFVILASERIRAKDISNRRNLRIKHHLTSTSTQRFLSTTLPRFPSTLNDRYDLIEVRTGWKRCFLRVFRLFQLIEWNSRCLKREANEKKKTKLL